MAKEYQIEVQYDAGDDVWIAFSKDIKGLALQAKTLSKLTAEIEICVPMLIEDDHEPNLEVRHKPRHKAPEIPNDVPQIRLNNFSIPVVAT